MELPWMKKRIAKREVSPLVKEFKDMKISFENTNQPQNYIRENTVKTGITNMRNCYRFQIKDVLSSRLKSQPQWVLTCQDAQQVIKKIMVRGEWARFEYQVGDIIHIVSDSDDKDAEPPHLVDDRNNLLVWSPDVLLTATFISDAVDCQRRAIIKNRFRAPTGEVSIPMLIGNMVHRIFQECLKTRNCDDKFVDSLVEEMLNESFVDILSSNRERQDIKNEIWGHFLNIKEWIRVYMALPDGSVNRNGNDSPDCNFDVTNVLDIEENIASPLFGLRGLIDVVIEARLKENGNKFVLPMEIKTGRAYLSNQTQVFLYTLLIKERYDVTPKSTCLVYSKTNETKHRAVPKMDIKSLIFLRNQLTQYMTYDVRELPPPLHQNSTCERCFEKEKCMVLNKLMDDSEDGSDGDPFITIGIL
ncbi:unnamed protein product [Ambrosiozyma monospora]|uniref:Unnamed protein product n=1 Tax=Ambrosiozyma monospora TaxID=43982 RepID=A0A9W6Z5E3_AMBMO|nr:unnamed protein product [Ambrosiozyma monospora]